MRHQTIGRRTFLGASLAGVCTAMAWAKGPAHAAGPRRIATFACDVTPPPGTPIYSSFKPLDTVEHPLLAKGVVIEDSGGRYVLCAVDWCEICNSTHDLFRDAIAKAADTQPARVAVQCAHQHTAPMADGDAARIILQTESPPPCPAVETMEAPARTVADAVSAALEQLTPFDSVGVSQAKVERVASNRRIPAGEGKVGFRASSCTDPAMVALPEGLIDPYLKTITFAREGRPLAQLHYYATHPQSFYGDPRASWDFVGMARERLEQETGAFQVYFTGCAGDIACGKYNDRTPEARQGLYERLYAAMAASAAEVAYGPAADLVWRTTPLVMQPRADAGFTKEDLHAEMRDASKPHSVRFTAAMTLAWQARVTQPIELSSWQMGDVFVAHLPGEPMIDYQLYAQELRAGQFVAVAGYGDGAPGYICLEKSFAEGGYEPTASFVVPESDSVFRAAIRTLLDA